MPPEPPLVQTMTVAPATVGIARDTGVIRVRTASNLGFRIGGKIFERLVGAVPTSLFLPALRALQFRAAPAPRPGAVAAALGMPAGLAHWRRISAR